MTTAKQVNNNQNQNQHNHNTNHHNDNENEQHNHNTNHNEFKQNVKNVMQHKPTLQPFVSNLKNNNKMNYEPFNFNPMQNKFNGLIYFSRFILVQ